jgi:subtilase family serine protease
MFPARHARIPLSAACLLISLALPASAFAFTQAEPPNPAPRIVTNIDEANLVTLKGNTHPAALPKFDQGAVSDSLPMQHMILVLQRSPEQEQALEKLLDEQQNPKSANYHKWLTAEELGKNYGPSAADISTVTNWLKYHGFLVNGVSKSGLSIDVSGTAGQIRDTFHTAIHTFDVAGNRHIANVSDPKIPAALAPVVVGFNALHDFMPKPAMRKAKPALTFTCDSSCPGGFAGVTQYDETPVDFNTIYNVPPNTGTGALTGAGQTVVVLEDSNAQSIDISTFRHAFGINKSGSFSQVHPTGSLTCANPGKTADEFEAAPDAEWANAIAFDANVELASCTSTTTFGGLIAAQNLLDLTTPPPIMSLSYVQCESSLGSTGNTFVNTLWQQAATEGVSVFVAAGDGGAAGCDDSTSASDATAGIAVNGYASTPFNVAAGGTDFKDTSDGNNTNFWKATNNSTTLESAKSYIPEIPWNDSCAGSVFYSFSGFASGEDSCNNASNADLLDIVAGSGGPSAVYAKPSWQVVDGNPADKKRDLPDVSLFASDGFWNHSIVFCMSDTGQDGTPCDYTMPLDVFNNSAGGTSFTAPQLASIQALINQKVGATSTASGGQGNVAPIYYGLAQTEYGTTAAPNTTNLANCKSNLGKNVSSTCVFYDITSGNINVPCLAGSSDCFVGVGDTIGVLSTSSTKESVAYPSKVGWDFSTGIGSVNVTNLVNSWP